MVCECIKGGMRRWLTPLLLPVLAALAACPSEPETLAANDPRVRSLDELSVESLRNRSYGSDIRIVKAVDSRPNPSFLAAYDSDGLRVYTRIDLPADAAPDDGYPIVILIHGWVGIDNAPSIDFWYDTDSNYGQMIEAYVAAGFAVLVPGWRGHGTVEGIPADGIEFMRAWDNGSYVSPVFYAIDVLNLIDSVGKIDVAPLDLDRINLVAHSQGGDVALTVLGVAGESSKLRNGISAASIWSGNIPPRMVQLETFWPMQTSPQAFLAGDGTWTGTASGSDGSVNPHYVFGYPADWIETPDPAAWTWQKDVWSNATVADALRVKLEQMYKAINDNVLEISDARYDMDLHDGSRTTIAHDARVIEGLSQIGAYDQEQYLSETLALHHSDRDFYSLPEWNAYLCRRANQAGGLCFDFTYPGNTHALRMSDHEWYSPAGTVEGFAIAIRRDIALFSSLDPSAIELQHDRRPD